MTADQAKSGDPGQAEYDEARLALLLRVSTWVLVILSLLFVLSWFIPPIRALVRITRGASPVRSVTVSDARNSSVVIAVDLLGNALWQADFPLGQYSTGLLDLDFDGLNEVLVIRKSANALWQLEAVFSHDGNRLSLPQPTLLTPMKPDDDDSAVLVARFPLAAAPSYWNIVVFTNDGAPIGYFLNAGEIATVFPLGSAGSEEKLILCGGSNVLISPAPVSGAPAGETVPRKGVAVVFALPLNVRDVSPPDRFRNSRKGLLGTPALWYQRADSSKEPPSSVESLQPERRGVRAVFDDGSKTLFDGKGKTLDGSGSVRLIPLE